MALGIVIAANLFMLLSLIPTPYWVIAPGGAIDLTSRVTVRGRPGPARRYDLIEVKLVRANVIALWTGFLPHQQLVPAHWVFLRGASKEATNELRGTMRDESLEAAAVVAERAAGYAVPIPERRVVVLDILPGAGAADVLRHGDQIDALDGVPVAEPHDVNLLLEKVPPGRSVFADVSRGGLHFRILVPTAQEAPRFGVLLEGRSDGASLPVEVSFDGHDVGGSSGGLMLALRIYDSLRPGGSLPAHVAGTGTLDYQGNVGPILGIVQKVMTAKRAGAGVFLCPRENYAQVSGERGITVVPVGTFDEAVRRLKALGSSTPVQARSSS